MVVTSVSGWRLFAVAGVLLAASAKAQGQIIRTILNANSSPTAGGLTLFPTDVVVLGDITGDTQADFVLNAPQSQGSYGSGLVAAYSAAVPTGPVQQWGVGAGNRLAGGLDVDGDGVQDWVIGSPGLVQSSGQCWVFSGATRTVIWQITGAPGDRFGTVVGMADLDGDGYGDIIATAPNAQIGGAPAYYMRAFSGRDHTVLWSQSFLSYYVVRIGDVNGDGCEDILIGGAVLSGVDGSILFTYPVETFIQPYLSACGDIDGDGVPDFLVTPGGQPVGAPTNAGQVFLRSGVDGSVIRHHVGVQAGDLFGWGTGGFHADSDGVPDYATRAQLTVPWTWWQGRMDVWSGATGQLLQTWNTFEFERLGLVYPIGDYDGDGSDELLIGAPENNDNLNCPFCGAAYVYQIRPGPVGHHRAYGKGCPSSDQRLPTASTTGLPVLGQSTTLHLRAGPPQSLVLLAAGPHLGLDLTPFGAPGCVAHVDPLVLFALPTDAVGRAAMTVAIPNTPSLSGADFHSQWLVLDPAANALGLATSTAVASVVGM